ncbi:MAG: hypothetical protein IK104_10790 [Clostridia bacterium]|nr:hypothetical protein [Clostridia bacterium]
MTDREVGSLSRTDLLELLIIARQEIDRLTSEHERIAAEMERVNSKLSGIYRELADARKILNNCFLFPDTPSEPGNAIPSLK